DDERREECRHHDGDEMHLQSGEFAFGRQTPRGLGHPRSSAPGSKHHLTDRAASSDILSFNALSCNSDPTRTRMRIKGFAWSVLAYPADLIASFRIWCVKQDR